MSNARQTYCSLFFLLGAYAHASNPNGRAFDTTHVETWKRKLDYEYAPPLNEPPPSNFLSKFLNALSNWLKDVFNLTENIFDSSSEAARNDSTIQNIIFLVLLLLIVGGIIYLLLTQFSFVFNKKTGAIINYQVKSDDIHSISFDAEINAAESANNYRTALRLRYLQVLQKLHEQGFIRWEPQKTNSYYVTEVRNTPLYPSFCTLSNTFDWVWYGHFAIDADTYAAFTKTQLELMHQIHKQETSYPKEYIS